MQILSGLLFHSSASYILSAHFLGGYFFGAKYEMFSFDYLYIFVYIFAITT